MSSRSSVSQALPGASLSNLGRRWRRTGRVDLFGTNNQRQRARLGGWLWIGLADAGAMRCYGDEGRDCRGGSRCRSQRIVAGPAFPTCRQFARVLRPHDCGRHAELLGELCERFLGLRQLRRLHRHSSARRVGARVGRGRLGRGNELANGRTGKMSRTGPQHCVQYATPRASSLSRASALVVAIALASSSSVTSFAPRSPPSRLFIARHSDTHVGVSAI